MSSYQEWEESIKLEGGTPTPTPTPTAPLDLPEQPERSQSTELLNKDFDQKQKDQHDPKSKIEGELLIRQVYGKEIEIKQSFVDQAEKYSVCDAEAYEITSGKVIRYEFEHRECWKQFGEFPWDTVHVAKRKEKSKSDKYLAFNKDYNTAIMTNMSNVLNSNIRTILAENLSTKNKSLEPFFDVKISLFTVFVKENGEWRIKG